MLKTIFSNNSRLTQTGITGTLIAGIVLCDYHFTQTMRYEP